MAVPAFPMGDPTLRKKYIALGTVFLFDSANSTIPHPTPANYAVLGCLTNLQLWTDEKELIELGCIADTELVELPGRKNPRDLNFTHFWTPGDGTVDTPDEELDDLYESEALASFKLVFPHGGTDVGDSTPVWEFAASVRILAPNPIEVNGTFQRPTTLRVSGTVSKALEVLT